MASNDVVKVPELNAQGGIPASAFTFTKVPVKVRNPETGKMETIEVDKAVLKDEFLKEEKVDHSSPKRTGNLGPLYENTTVRIHLNEGCPLEVFPIGDLCVLKNFEYTLRNSDDPIDEISTGIPDTAPLSGNWQGKFVNPSAIANRQRYKTQAQLLKHVLDHPARYSPHINVKYEQTPIVGARLNADKAKNIKEQILEEKRAAERRVSELEKELIRAQSNEEKAKLEINKD